MLHAARWFEPDRDGRVHCTLCPRDCRIGPGQTGFCFVRRNEDGKLVTAAYGRSTGFAIDPIEKKPLDHFRPGSRVLSFGTAGCNLGCRFCQNWSISKAQLDEAREEGGYAPEDVVAIAKAEGATGIAFTYNDPVIWAEWAIDVARAARAAGLFTVFVTAGFVTPAARAEIFREMDATNVDLKAFTEDFYRKVTLSHLAPVLDTLAWLARETKVWVEVTNLVIPGLNDDPAETRALAEWMRANLGPDVPLHLTAFHPDYKLLDRPGTPPATLSRARAIAREVGLHHVYTGNVRDPEGQTTFCPGCGAAVIRRDGYAVRTSGLRGSACAACGTLIAGRFGEGAVVADGRRTMLGLAR
jgi:pyruvate formate lyase activating enzyme